jgi:hypothetical protein
MPAAAAAETNGLDTRWKFRLVTNPNTMIHNVDSLAPLLAGRAGLHASEPCMTPLKRPLAPQQSDHFVQSGCVCHLAYRAGAPTQAARQ